jgi:hypothetical protein
VGRETVSLSEALSIMAFGSQVEPTDVDKVERAAFKQQAWGALFTAAGWDDVIMPGSNAKLESDVRPKRIDIIFELCLEDQPNSLERDYERGDLSSTKSQ